MVFHIYPALPSSGTILGNSEVGPVIGSRSRLKFGQQYPTLGEDGFRFCWDFPEDLNLP